MQAFARQLAFLVCSLLSLVFLCGPLQGQAMQDQSLKLTLGQKFRYKHSSELENRTLLNDKELLNVKSKMDAVYECLAVSRVGNVWVLEVKVKDLVLVVDANGEKSTYNSINDFAVAKGIAASLGRSWDHATYRLVLDGDKLTLRDTSGREREARGADQSKDIPDRQELNFNWFVEGVPRKGIMEWDVESEFSGKNDWKLRITRHLVRSNISNAVCEMAVTTDLKVGTVPSEMNGAKVTKSDFRIRDAKGVIVFDLNLGLPVKGEEKFLIEAAVTTETPGIFYGKTVSEIRTFTMMASSWMKLEDPVNSKDLQIGRVHLSKEVVEREASVERVEAEPGITTEFKKKRTISHESTFFTRNSVGKQEELKFGANWLLYKADLSGSVRSSIESETGAKFSDSDTREQSVTIDGNKIRKVDIIWIDMYRTGTIDVTDQGAPRKVLFEFPLGTRLVIRKVE